MDAYAVSGIHPTAYQVVHQEMKTRQWITPLHLSIGILRCSLTTHCKHLPVDSKKKNQGVRYTGGIEEGVMACSIYGVDICLP